MLAHPDLVNPSPPTGSAAPRRPDSRCSRSSVDVGATQILPESSQLLEAILETTDAEETVDLGKCLSIYAEVLMSVESGASP